MLLAGMTRVEVQTATGVVGTVATVGDTGRLGGTGEIDSNISSSSTVTSYSSSGSMACALLAIVTDVACLGWAAHACRT
jgi:hypothetical protein